MSKVTVTAPYPSGAIEAGLPMKTTMSCSSRSQREDGALQSPTANTCTGMTAASTRSVDAIRTIAGTPTRRCIEDKIPSCAKKFLVERTYLDCSLFGGDRLALYYDLFR